MFPPKLRTPYGCFQVLMSEQGIRSLFFPQNRGRKPIPNHRPLKKDLVSAKCFPVPAALSKAFRSYFTGRRISFRKWPIDWSGCSAFERRVLKACMKIPFGRTASYLDLAKKIGNQWAARAVGNALGKNHIPILIPCHRIRRSDGQLGGYAAGMKWKRRLLALERAVPDL